MILHKIHFDNSYLNTSYILKDLHSNEAIIIDVPEDPFPIIEQIEKLKVKIKLVLLTHHHLDHSGGLSALREKYDFSVALGQTDCRSNPNERVGYVDPDIEINDGDVFYIGEEEIKSITVPGHTLGSNCFLIDNKLFTGDVLFPGRAGITDSPEQFELAISSLKDKIYVLNEEIEFFPGHGKGGEKIKDFKTQFDIFLKSDYAGKHGVVWWVEGYKGQW